MKRPDRYTLGLLFCLILGGFLRFAGLTRGHSDFVLPEAAREGKSTAFYHFHPDEESLVRGALELDNPLDPPFTVYGMLPLYLARGVLEAAALVLNQGSLDFYAPQDRFFIFVTVRALAALLSCLSLGLVYLLGCRHFDRPTAGLGLFFVALAPLAIQQAHFYTVDGVFTFLVLAFFLVALPAVGTGRVGLYLLGGALIGATAAVRLNGLLLGGVLLAGHLLHGDGAEGSGFARVGRRLLTPELWLAGLAAVLVLLLLQPFLVAAPELLQQEENPLDFAYALLVTRGALLRPWSLVYVHTLPFLYYWTDLWPSSVGWPLTLAFLGGVGWALWRRTTAGILMLLWVGGYFAVMGGVHNKHVRYLLPLLPFLGLLTASWCRALFRVCSPVGKWLGVILTGSLVVYTGWYGLAFGGIYTVEDSRIQAGRWISEHVPHGKVVGVEGGGFSLRPVLSRERHHPRLLDLAFLFKTQKYCSCRAMLSYLRIQQANMDYLAIVDVNRFQQFTAAPDLFPAVAEFYEHLVRGQLGFELVERFKHYPTFLGLQFTDDGAEPSFLGYDHPAVLIFRKKDPTAVLDSLECLQKRLEDDSRCADGLLQQAALSLKDENLAPAQQTLQQVATRYPEMKVGHLIASYIHRLRGDEARQNTAIEQYESGVTQVSPLEQSFFLVPAASSLTLIDLGLEDLALSALVHGLQYTALCSPERLHIMASTYILIGDLFDELGQPEYARATCELSLAISEEKQAHNRLADLAFRASQFDRATELWERSLELDSTQAQVHRNLGRVAAQHLHNYARAAHHWERATQLDPDLKTLDRPEDYNLLAAGAYFSRQFDRAIELWERSVELDSTQAQVHVAIGQVAAQHLHDYARATRHWERAARLDPKLRAELENLISQIKPNRAE